jgi:hypothetical protein
LCRNVTRVRLAKLAILPLQANLRQPLNLNKPSGPGLCQVYM